MPGPYHYVDSKDQHTAASGVDDHSDLTTAYVEAKVKVLGPWMQETDRQKILKTERDKIQTGLRKSIVLIGLSISLPIVFGILVEQLGMAKVDLINAYSSIFLLLGLGITGVLTTFLLLKWVSRRFHKHNLRALPITLTTLLTLFLVIQKVFDLTNNLIGGLIGYAVGLAGIVLLSIVIAGILIFAWTSPKLPGLAKLIVLLLFLVVGGVVFRLL